ncbi:MAG: hypothetical protein NUV73_00720 [Candidatus Daviesbacteria bacterium]|nr:hypothetical protein [Candidatus Daviesbacteria bacterium]
MGNFNRNGRSGGGRGFERRGFNDRGSRGPMEMHQAVCDSCRKNCEVPFRPTSGKPIFCSDCFQNNRGSDSRRFEGRNSDRSAGLDERRMFEAVCDECRNSCKVPFQPSGGKPIYCSDCFGEKKGAGDKNRDQFAELHSKLDKILLLLNPDAPIKAAAVIQEEIIEEIPQIEETVTTEKKAKTAKKKSSKK